MNAHLRINSWECGWNKVYVGGEHLGGYGETTYASEDMRWYWSADGSFGHCATRDEAVEALHEQVPSFLALKAREKANAIEFAAMPEDLQALKVEMDWAEVERERVWGRNPFNQADYASAFTRAHQANTAFHAAFIAWQSRKEAA